MKNYDHAVLSAIGKDPLIASLADQILENIPLLIFC